jgi:hypothetical protein
MAIRESRLAGVASLWEAAPTISKLLLKSYRCDIHTNASGKKIPRRFFWFK